jgi:membrane protein required for beta-lactamase induction
MPLASLVARFEPEWNSTVRIKTRTFNILGGLMGGLMHWLAALSSNEARIFGRILRMASEDLMI